MRFRLPLIRSRWARGREERERRGWRTDEKKDDEMKYTEIIMKYTQIKTKKSSDMVEIKRGNKREVKVKVK
jgi:hypothetical protein